MSRAAVALIVLAMVIFSAALPAAEESSQAPPTGDDAQPPLVQTRVHGVAVEPETNSPVVILATLDKTRYLPIFVGEAEAAAIWRYLNNVDAPRPMTHDLLSKVIDELGGDLRAVTVTGLKNGVFYASIEIAAGENMITIDARPSDSIALAVKRGTDVINVAQEVMEQAGRRSELPREDDEDKGEPPPDVPEAI